MQQDPGLSTLTLTSKFGQAYQCIFQDRHHDEQKEQEEEKVAMETGIPDLLKPIADGPCLMHVSSLFS